MTLETKLEKPLTSGVNAFSANLGSSALKTDCDIMSFEWKFRLQLWFIQSRLLTPLVWLLSKRVPVSKDFGHFGGRKKDKSMLDLAGMLQPPDGRHVSIEEMNAWRTSVDKGHPLPLASKLDDKKFENVMRLTAPGGSVPEIEATAKRRGAAKLDSGKGSG